MSKSVKVGIIGLGPRAETLAATLREMPNARITAVCDYAPQRLASFDQRLQQCGIQALKFSDFRELLASDEVEAVLIPTSWNSHLHIAKVAMQMGKRPAIEVGGAASIDELWQLVHAAEDNNTDCMMLENCCYGRNELLTMNMVRQGLFGEIIHCECGYCHEIVDELTDTNGPKSERGWHNLRRNGDLYPTHGIGPIAQILNINRGNRFLSITSMASKSRAMTSAAGGKFTYNCGDVVTSMIKCANGETITLTHSVSLPRPYSRRCLVQGTKGIWSEEANSIFVEGISETENLIDVAGNPYTSHNWDPVEKFYDQYEHPIWQRFKTDGVIGGHGGMDALAMSAFFDALANNKPLPIDVYDCAAWMSITALSEESIALGSAPVAFPDFTNGKWINR